MPVAIVTGVAGAMGGAISTALGLAGTKVVGVDRARPSEGSFDVFVEGDVRDPALCAQAFAAAAGLGEEEVYLVNNAGVTRPGAPQNDDDWDETLSINLTAPFRWTRRYAGAVRDGAIVRGGVVFIGSLAAVMGFPDNPAYHASKSGVLGLSRAFAADLGAAGIRVNCVSPGYIETAMTARSSADPQTYDARRAQTLLGRWGQARDVAGAVAYLCSPAAEYVTGTNLVVDGGWTCRGLAAPPPRKDADHA